MTPRRMISQALWRRSSGWTEFEKGCMDQVRSGTGPERPSPGSGTPSGPRATGSVVPPKILRSPHRAGAVLCGAAALASILCLWQIPALAQTPAKAAPVAPRKTADGKPDLNGFWEALNTAAWDIQDHIGQL